MNVYTLTIIDLRCNEPDAYVSVYQNKEDAIQAGIAYARSSEFNLTTDEEKYEELDGGDGLKRDSVYILPISTTLVRGSPLSGARNFQITVPIGGQSYRMVAKIQAPSEDFITGFLCGFSECMDFGDFKTFVYKQIKNKRIFFHDASTEGLVKVFDETAEEIKCLVQLHDDITVAVENMGDFVRGIASSQKSAFEFQKRKGYENNLSPASWINLKYISLALCDDGEVYEEIFEDGFVLGEKVAIPDTVEVSFE